MHEGRGQVGDTVIHSSGPGDADSTSVGPGVVHRFLHKAVEHLGPIAVKTAVGRLWHTVPLGTAVVVDHDLGPGHRIGKYEASVTHPVGKPIRNSEQPTRLVVPGVAEIHPDAASVMELDGREQADQPVKVGLGRGFKAQLALEIPLTASLVILPFFVVRRGRDYTVGRLLKELYNLQCVATVDLILLPRHGPSPTALPQGLHPEPRWDRIGTPGDIKHLPGHRSEANIHRNRDMKGGVRHPVQVDFAFRNIILLFFLNVKQPEAKEDENVLGERFWMWDS